MDNSGREQIIFNLVEQGLPRHEFQVYPVYDLPEEGVRFLEIDTHDPRFTPKKVVELLGHAGLMSDGTLDKLSPSLLPITGSSDENRNNFTTYLEDVALRGDSRFHDEAMTYYGELHIVVLDITPRIYDALVSAGVSTVGHLMHTNPEDLMAQSKLVDRGIALVNEALKKLDLTVGQYANESKT